MKIKSKTKKFIIRVFIVLLPLIIAFAGSVLAGINYNPENLIGEIMLMLGLIIFIINIFIFVLVAVWLDVIIKELEI